MDAIIAFLSIAQILGLVALFLVPRDYRPHAAIIAGIFPIIKYFTQPPTIILVAALIAGIGMILVGCFGLWCQKQLRKG